MVDDKVRNKVVLVCKGYVQVEGMLLEFSCLKTSKFIKWISSQFFIKEI